MPKHFIKITREYSTKNKAQELCLKNIKMLDHILCPDLDEAKKLITKRYQDAISSYVGRAALPELKEFSPHSSTTKFYIEDVVYVEVYEVSLDFSLLTTQNNNNEK